MQLVEIADTSIAQQAYQRWSVIGFCDGIVPPAYLIEARD